MIPLTIEQKDALLKVGQSPEGFSLPDNTPDNLSKEARVAISMSMVQAWAAWGGFNMEMRTMGDIKPSQGLYPTSVAAPDMLTPEIQAILTKLGWKAEILPAAKATGISKEERQALMEDVIASWLHWSGFRDNRGEFLVIRMPEGTDTGDFRKAVAGVLKALQLKRAAASMPQGRQ